MRTNPTDLSSLDLDGFINHLEALLNHPRMKDWVKASYIGTLMLALYSLQRRALKREIQ